MRDKHDNVVVICSIERRPTPMGRAHPATSITVAAGP